jgi:methionine synthase I (cobalamin-dependent)
MLLNVNTHRKYWHSGAGIDDPNTFDRYEHEMKKLGDIAKQIHEQTKNQVKEAWQKQLDKQ